MSSDSEITTRFEVAYTYQWKVERLSTKLQRVYEKNVLKIWNVDSMVKVCMTMN